MSLLRPFRALRPPAALAARVASPPYDVISTAEARAMSILRPFRALRPPAALAARVASPPYDVVSTAEARALAAGNRDSYLRVSRPEIDLPAGTDEHGDQVYAQGKSNLDELVRRGVLLAEAAPRYFVYAQRMGGHRQVGLVACASVEEYDRGLI